MHITIITMMMMIIIIINIQCSIYIYIIYMYTNILSQSSTIGYNMILYAFFFYVICMILDSSACQAAEEFIAVLKRRCSSCLRSSTLCVED